MTKRKTNERTQTLTPSQDFGGNSGAREFVEGYRSDRSDTDGGDEGEKFGAGSRDDRVIPGGDIRSRIGSAKTPATSGGSRMPTNENYTPPQFSRTKTRGA